MSDTPDMADTPAPSDMADMSGMSPVSYVSMTEAAHRLQLSERQVRRYVKRGLLPAIRQQGQVRIATDAIEDLRAQRTAVEGQAVTPDRDASDTADMSPPVSDVHHVPVAPASIAPLLASIQADLVAAREQIERLARALGHVEAERDVLRAEVERLQALAPQAPQLSALADRLDALETEGTRLDALTQDQVLERDGEVDQAQQVMVLREQVAELTRRLNAPMVAPTPPPPPRPTPSWRARLARWWRS